ncbi:hypothetical protein [Aquamicrobium sp. LC103]|uniref:hypothetical protein n=1 Tax=Aquamicrobium sp. LC103 TaxID=1120658 RepID=UPI00063EA554|nr:hypothetical protein [Aquamicrobium sp. LC103]TKT69072.1 hypothetical protein XW59_029155 [Aquamicrobium sp. LC103]
MAMVGAAATEVQRGQERKNQLLEIMVDAAKSVLERPESRRGPYVIADSDLKHSPRVDLG